MTTYLVYGNVLFKYTRRWEMMDLGMGMFIKPHFTTCTSLEVNQLNRKGRDKRCDENSN